MNGPAHDPPAGPAQPVAHSWAPWWRQRWAQTLASLLVAAALVGVLHRGSLPLVPGRQAFADVHWPAVGTYLAIWCCIHALRAGRWYWLLAAVHRVPLPRVMSVGFVGFLAIALLPFRTGELVRPVLIREQGRLSGWEATGTVAAERIVDGLCLTTLTLVALSLAPQLSPLPSHIGDLPVPAAAVPQLARAAFLLFALAFASMGLFYFCRSWARRATLALVGVVSKPAARWLADRVEQLSRGFQFLPQARYTTPFALATVLYWLLNGYGSLVLAHACGLSAMTYWQACVVMGVLGLGIVVPNAPGFFGAFQISVYAALAMFFEKHVVVEAGAVFVFLLYVIQMSVALVAGATAGLLDRSAFRVALQASSQSSES